MAPDQQPLELILARNLTSTIETPALVADAEGSLVFYNDAAAKIIGARFEETGPRTQDEWRAALTPEDRAGRQTPSDEGGPLSVALRDGRPSHGSFHIRARDDELLEVEASALPLTGPAGFNGALVAFWPVED